MYKDSTIEANPDHVSDFDLQQLRDKIERVNKAREMQRLKKELADITYNANLQAGNSAMDVADTSQVLCKRQNVKPSILNAIYDRLIMMLSPTPVIGSIIGLIIAFSVYSVLHSGLLTNIAGYDIHKYLPYAGYTSLVTAGLIIIGSSKRGLLLPSVAFIFGLFGTCATEQGGSLFSFEHGVFQIALMIGSLGLLMGALAIDRPRNNGF